MKLKRGACDLLGQIVRPRRDAGNPLLTAGADLLPEVRQCPFAKINRLGQRGSAAIFCPRDLRLRSGIIAGQGMQDNI